MDDKLDVLKQITQVDTPPFLLTRIRQQIHTMGYVEAPTYWKWAFSLTAAMLVVVNIFILVYVSDVGTSEKQLEIERVVSSMNLDTVNDFYHE